jgi:FdhE protein
LLRIQAEVESGLDLPEIALNRQELEQRLKNGIPLFSLKERELDKVKVNDTFHRIAALFAEYPEVLGPVPQALKAADFDLPADLANSWLEGGEFPAELSGEQISPALVGSLIQQTMRPFLIGYGKAISRQYDQDVWRRPYCPVCGSDPEFSHLEKETGARFLLCPSCCAEWQYLRTQCPYCGNADPKTLSYYTGEDGLYRLYLCEQCKCYLKAIDLRKTTENKIPALESLTTLPLDRQAHEMGYHRGERQREAVE